jgi:hypothetical protein
MVIQVSTGLGGCRLFDDLSGHGAFRAVNARLGETGGLAITTIHSLRGLDFDGTTAFASRAKRRFVTAGKTGRATVWAGGGDWLGNGIAEALHGSFIRLLLLLLLWCGVRRRGLLRLIWRIGRIRRRRRFERIRICLSHNF